MKFKNKNSVVLFLFKLEECKEKIAGPLLIIVGSLFQDFGSCIVLLILSMEEYHFAQEGFNTVKCSPQAGF